MAITIKYTITDKYKGQHLITFTGKGLLRKQYTAQINVNISEKSLGKTYEVKGIAKQRSEIILGVKKLIHPNLIKPGMTVFYGERLDGIIIREAAKT